NIYLFNRSFYCRWLRRPLADATLRCKNANLLEESLLHGCEESNALAILVPLSGLRLLRSSVQSGVSRSRSQHGSSLIGHRSFTTRSGRESIEQRRVDVSTGRRGAVCSLQRLSWTRLGTAVGRLRGCVLVVSRTGQRQTQTRELAGRFDALLLSLCSAPLVCDFGTDGLQGGGGVALLRQPRLLLALERLEVGGVKVLGQRLTVGDVVIILLLVLVIIVLIRIVLVIVEFLIVKVVHPLSDGGIGVHCLVALVVTHDSRVRSVGGWSIGRLVFYVLLGYQHILLFRTIFLLVQIGVHIMGLSLDSGEFLLLGHSEGCCLSGRLSRVESRNARLVCLNVLDRLLDDVPDFDRPLLRLLLVLGDHEAAIVRHAHVDNRADRMHATHQQLQRVHNIVRMAIVRLEYGGLGDEHFVREENDATRLQFPVFRVHSHRGGGDESAALAKQPVAGRAKRILHLHKLGAVAHLLFIALERGQIRRSAAHRFTSGSDDAVSDEGRGESLALLLGVFSCFRQHERLVESLAPCLSAVRIQLDGEQTVRPTELNRNTTVVECGTLGAEERLVSALVESLDDEDIKEDNKAEVCRLIKLVHHGYFACELQIVLLENASSGSAKKLLSDSGAEGGRGSSFGGRVRPRLLGLLG
ncbi:hypothetical protein PFISCL1PPCAC_26678, partial [Pristionchus fissidentatus]